MKLKFDIGQKVLFSINGTRLSGKVEEIRAWRRDLQDGKIVLGYKVCSSHGDYWLGENRLS
jgi:hypothetical protein